MTRRAKRVPTSLRTAIVAALLLATAVFLVPPTTEEAQALAVLHTVGNVSAQISDVGRIERLNWNGVNQLATTGTQTEVGLALDQANYDHAPQNGGGNDADGFYIADSFEDDFSVYVPIYFEENTASQQKSVVVFNHTNDDPDDIAVIDNFEVIKGKDDVSVEQWAWTAAGKDWLVLRWEVTNVNTTDITGFRFTVYGGYSGLADIFNTYLGVGNDNGDDVESYNTATARYYVQDQSDSTTLGIASADASLPFTRYVSRIHEFVSDLPEDDTLYEMVATDPNGLTGADTQGISTVLGWVPGTIPAGQTRVYSMVFAFGWSTAAVDAAIDDARQFYTTQTTYMSITEIQDSPSVQVEVWNNGLGLVDLSTWTLRSTAGPLAGTWTPTSINDGQYSVFSAASGLDPEGDLLTLRDAGNQLRDQIGYGYRGPAPDPLNLESAAKVWDAGKGRYINQWSRQATANFGGPNTVPKHDPSPSVVLNEVLYNPVSRTGFIEIYYNGLTSVDISNYVIVVDREYVIPGGTVLDTTRRWFVLQAPQYPLNFAVTPANDNVYLYRPTGEFADMVGWNTPHSIDTSLVRKPDGNGTAEGYDDASSTAAGWVFDQLATMNLLGIQERQTRGGNPGYTVEFFLNVTNFKADTDTVDLWHMASPDTWPVQFLTVARTPLPNTGGGPEPDTGPLNQGQTATVIFSVSLPANPPVGREENITVYGDSNTNPMVTAGVDLVAQVFPHLEVEKTSVFSQIYVQGSGFVPETTPVTVTLRGEGVPQIDQRPQDVVFEVDNSGSMGGPGGSDPAFLRWDAVGCYINQMTLPDRGAIVAFGQNPATGNTADAWYVRAPLTEDYSLLYSDTQDPANRFAAGWTPISLALQLGNDELVSNGNLNHTWVEILLTDGYPAPDPPYGDVSAQLAQAVQYGIRIFTIGLGTGVNENFLRNIADTTGGIYYPADSPDDLCSIYQTIGTIIQDIAGRPQSNGVTPMIVERVPQPFEVVAGSIVPAPANVWTDVNGETVIEWQLSQVIRVGQQAFVNYDVRCNNAGTWNATDWPRAIVNYESWDAVDISSLIPSLFIECLPGVDPQPPRNVRTSVGGGNQDVVVAWDPPADTTGVDGYYVYMSPTPVDFDFSAPWQTVLGVNNLTYTDSGAAQSLGERYYTVRSFNQQTLQASATGNTAGKHTVDLPAGRHAIAYPLEPFDPVGGPLTAATLQTQLQASLLQEIDAAGAWVVAAGNVGPGDGFLVDRPGSGYVTYTGLPAAMISYRDGFGYGYGNALVRSLRIAVSGSDLTVSWSGPGVAVAGYELYRSPTRLGFFDGTATDLGNVVTPSFFDGSVLPLGQVCYMVVPVDSLSARGGGTYSACLFSTSLPGQALVGLPLIPFTTGPVSWYADQIPEAFGILWYDTAAGVWVPHFREMAAGVYDRSVSRTIGYQVGTRVPATYLFIGW